MHARAFILTFLVILSATSAASVRAQDQAATPAATPAGSIPVEFVWEIGGGSEPFEMPQDVGIDPAGNLWVLDMAHHQFQIFSPDGEFIESWGRMGEGEGEFSFFAGPIAVSTEFGGEVAFDQDGNAHVADMANQRIQTFAPDHTFLAAWGEAGFQEGQFSRPFNLAFDAAGSLYVADFGRATIQVFDRDGTYLHTLADSHAGPNQLHEPGGLAIAPDGAIWVGDWITHQLLQYSPDGTLLAVIGGYGTDEGQFGSPSIWAGADGLIYEADADNDRVQILDADGQFVAAFGSSGSAPGQFLYPTGVVTDEAGNIYVADFGNNRVQKFRLVQPLPAAASPTP